MLICKILFTPFNVSFKTQVDASFKFDTSYMYKLLSFLDKTQSIYLFFLNIFNYCNKINIRKDFLF